MYLKKISNWFVEDTAGFIGQLWSKKCGHLWAAKVSGKQSSYAAAG